MNETEFDDLKSRLNFGPGSLQILHMVLVQGMTVKHVALLKGCSTQRIYDLLGRARKVQASIPKNWRKVVVWLPPDEADRVERLSVSLQGQERARKGVFQIRRVDCDDVNGSP